jgi:hypothetical protein
MNKFGLIAIISGLALSTGAMAEPTMTKDAYKAEKERIKDDYKADKARCGSFSGNAKDICLAEAEGKEDVAEADLEARYKPSKASHKKAAIAKAEADYKVAKEKCDDQSGNAKDVCLKDAKATEAAEKANASKGE